MGLFKLCWMPRSAYHHGGLATECWPLHYLPPSTVCLWPALLCNANILCCLLPVLHTHFCTSWAIVPGSYVCNLQASAPFPHLFRKRNFLTGSGAEVALPVLQSFVCFHELFHVSIIQAVGWQWYHPFIHETSIKYLFMFQALCWVLALPWWPR